MARTPSSPVLCLSDHIGRIIALFAAVLLLSALAPATAFAEGTWAETKEQQLLQAYEQAESDYQAAVEKAEELEAAYLQAGQPIESLNNEWEKAKDWASEYEACESAGNEDELYNLKLAIASEYNIDAEDVTEALLAQIVADAESALEEAVYYAEETQRLYADALREKDAAEKTFDDAKHAYEDYLNLPLCEFSFDLAGGTLDGQTGTITNAARVGDVVNLPGAPTREGFTFKFWKGSEYAAGAEYTVEEGHDFTAEWEENTSSDEPADDDATKSDSKAKSAIPATGDSLASLPIALTAVAALAAVCLAFAALKLRRDDEA